jgi:hypothetical protein
MHLNARTLFVIGGCAAAIACGGSDGSVGPPPPPPPPPPGTRVGYYVEAPPYGTSTGDGTNAAPWDLATALAGGHTNTVQPGDTVWIRVGTYVGSFQTSLNGQPAAPIVFRQYPGERATINGSLAAGGSYLWFWGFEIMQTNPLTIVDRVLEANTVNGKFINLVLHDAGFSGVSMAPNGGSGVELYGSIVYNNGFRDNIDHGIYAHNTTTGTKYITDNVFFNNFARGIQVYEAGSNLIRNFQVVGNVSFNNGSISGGHSSEINLLISAPATLSGMVAKDNLLYFSPGSDGIQLRLGNYDTSDSAIYNKDIDIESNYAVGGAVGIEMQYQWAQAAVLNNTFVGSTATDMVHTGGPTPNVYQWSGNVYYRDPAANAWQQDGISYTFAGWKTATGLGLSDNAIAGLPGGSWVFVRPNQYEAGRAFVVVYNFGLQNPVAVDLSGVVALNAHYEVRNVQDPYGTPLVSGTYGGGSVQIPMNGVAAPKPIGRSVPSFAPKTGPAFDVFLVTSAP